MLSYFLGPGVLMDVVAPDSSGVDMGALLTVNFEAPGGMFRAGRGGDLAVGTGAVSFSRKKAFVRASYCSLR